MPAFILLAPVLLLAVILYFVLWTRYFIWVLPPTIMYAAIIYVFSQQINYWWYERFPPKIDKDMEALMMRFFPYYRNLSPELKLLFGQRFTLFNHETEYITKELPFVPPDVMTLISATAMQVTFGLKEGYLLEQFNMVVLYRQAFHTPMIQRFHTGEIHREDGCVILAIDPVLQGINQPKDFYNMAIHQWAMALAHQNGVREENYCFFDKNEGDGHLQLLNHLAKIRGWEHRLEQDYLPFEKEDIFGICVEHFFNAPARFEKELPKMYAALKGILMQDPLNAEYPVILSLKV